MFFKKSFNLNKDTEKFFKPKKSRWCRCIVTASLCGFALILVLANVNFKRENGKKTENMRSNAKMFSPAKNIMIDEGDLTTSTDRCFIYIDTCSVVCVNSTLKIGNQDTEPLYKKCKRDLGLKLMNYSFAEGGLRFDLFGENYRFKTLELVDSNLIALERGTFSHSSVKNLRKLAIINTNFSTLDEYSFEGLQIVQHFELINEQYYPNLKATGFLKNFGCSLRVLNIELHTKIGTAEDPSPWLQGAEMKLLVRVSLSNNYFRDVLNNQTFSTLQRVEELILSRCSINYLEDTVFNSILKTLKGLDLSDNELLTLPGHILRQMSSLNLRLSGNYWDCSCRNKEMIQIISSKFSDINLLDEDQIKCYSPPKWRSAPFWIVRCDWNLDGDKATTNSTDYTTNNLTSDFVTATCSNGEYEKWNHTTTRTAPINYPASAIKPKLYFQEPQRCIKCSANGHSVKCNQPVLTEICSLSIKPISATSVKILLDIFRYVPAILYFTNVSNYNFFTNIKRENDTFFGIIDNIDPFGKYVFCCLREDNTIHNYMWNTKVSPFDCRGYSQPTLMLKPWLAKEDRAWISFLVALGICLMLFLGALNVVIALRFKMQKSNKTQTTLWANLEMEGNNLEPISGLAKNHSDTGLNAEYYLHILQHESAENVAQRGSSNSNNNFYEEML